jgi:hypothetical protein
LYLDKQRERSKKEETCLRKNYIKKTIYFSLKKNQMEQQRVTKNILKEKLNNILKIKFTAPKHITRNKAYKKRVQ